MYVFIACQMSLYHSAEFKNLSTSSVCASVILCHMLMYCVKMTETIIKQAMHIYGRPTK